MRETTGERTDRERGEGQRNIGEPIRENTDGWKIFHRKKGGDLPPMHAQAEESSRRLIANDRVIILAGENERAVGDKTLPIALTGMHAEDAAQALQIDGAINKALGATVVVAEDGVAYRSSFEADNHVVLVRQDSTQPINHHETTGVHEPQPGDILAVVDTQTATRMCNEPGLDSWRNIENSLLLEKASYAILYFPEEITAKMAASRSMRHKRNGTAPWAAAATPAVAAGGLASADMYRTPHSQYTYDEDNLMVGPENQDGRPTKRRRGGKLGAALAGGAAAASTRMFFLKNRLKSTDRRENETDEAYERRKNRRKAAAIALGGVAVLGAIWLTKWAHENGGIINGLGLDEPNIDWNPFDNEAQEPTVAPSCPSPEFNQNLGLPDDYCSYPEIPIPEDPRTDIVPDPLPSTNIDILPDPDGAPIPDIDAPAPNVPTPDVDAPSFIDGDYTQESRAIAVGEGWYDTFDQMGITDEAAKERLINDSALMERLAAGNLAYHDSNLFEEWGIKMTPDQTMPEWALDAIADTHQEFVQADSSPEVPADTLSAAVESLEGTPAENIAWGEGWLQTFSETMNEIGITDPNKQYALHNNYTLMSELQEMGLAYHRDDGWGLFMTENGTLPYEAKEIIVRFANPDAYRLAS